MPGKVAVPTRWDPLLVVIITAVCRWEGGGLEPGYLD